MCGIAGFCRHPDDHFNANTLSRNLLLEIEERGRDATGAAWRDRRGKLVLQKYDVKASDFVPRLALDKRAPVAVLHTRLATQGSPSNNDNNHPIPARHITGVHNGMVSNDWELFADIKGYKRQAQVDSEAIFATLSEVDESFTVKDALESIEARMALAWLDETDNHPDVLHLARGDGSPLVVGQSHNGTLIFASTKKAVVNAAESVGLELPYIEEMKEGVRYTVFQGRIIHVENFEPKPQYYTYSYTPARSTNGVLGVPKTSYTTPTSAKQASYVSTWAGNVLDMKYLDVDCDIPLMSYNQVSKSYVERDKAVGQWVEDHAYDPTTGEAIEDRKVYAKAAARGAFLRPGSWVTTYVKDEICDAQVYRMPKTFPNGDYVLRVIMPVSDDRGEYIGMEGVFLARTAAELDGADFYLTATDEDNDFKSTDETTKEVTTNA